MFDGKRGKLIGTDDPSVNDPSSQDPPFPDRGLGVARQYSVAPKIISNYSLHLCLHVKCPKQYYILISRFLTTLRAF